MPIRHHVIISGTGRAGTTFLVQLLTALKQDTGYHDNTAVHPNCDAGMEMDLRSPNAPYFVKNPWLCDMLADILRSGSVVIDHAFVPVRELFAAAESRRDVSRRANPELYAKFGIDLPGGCWPSDQNKDQESVLARKFYSLLETLAANDIPTTLLHFPRLATDPAYLFRKLSACLPGIEYPQFEAAFMATSRPEKIHPFAKTQ